MNILMLGWELPPHNSGGLGVACFALSKALARHGASIDFVVPYKANHSSASFMKVLSAVDLPPLHDFGLGGYASTLGVSNPELSGVRTIRDVQKHYVRYVEHLMKNNPEYDAIHVHDWLTMEAGVVAKQLSGKPLIAHVHATEFDRSGGEYGDPVIHEIEEQGLLAADRIIAVSKATKALIVNRYKIPAEKIDVIHNALDTEALANASYDTSTYLYLNQLKQHGYTVVATVTRFTVQKGLAYFMQAAAKASQHYEKMVFLLAGDGEQRNELLQMLAELGIADKVFFTGFVRGKQWREAFAVADVFVMSSVSEPFGITALEAAYHENALILTKQTGASEVLRSVYLYDFWDVNKLADELVALASSAALRATMVENVSTEYARISWHDMAAKCIELYKMTPELVAS